MTVAIALNLSSGSSTAVTAARTQNDYTTSIWDIVDRFTRGKIKPAPHQRDFVWTREKIRAWIKTMLETTQSQDAPLPTGYLLLYQVPGDDTTIWLNDGFQRLSATLEFIQHPERFNRQLTRDQAREIAHNFYCSVQHRQYRSHEQAMTIFQFVNFGTPLTNAEFCKGLLMDKEGGGNNPSVNWLPTLETLHSFMEEFTNRVSTHKALNPNQAAYWSRHDYALFYRFLSRSKQLRELNEPVSQRTVSLTAVQNGRTVEQVLRAELDRQGIKRVLEELEAFRQIIQIETELIGNTWIRHKGIKARPMPKTVLRWLLGVAIWRRNNSIDTSKWLAFLNLLLSQEFDGSRINCASGKPWRIIGLEKVHDLPYICQSIGSDFCLPSSYSSSPIKKKSVKRV